MSLLTAKVAQLSHILITVPHISSSEFLSKQFFPVLGTIPETRILLHKLLFGVHSCSENFQNTVSIPIFACEFFTKLFFSTLKMFDMHSFQARLKTLFLATNNIDIKVLDGLLFYLSEVTFDTLSMQVIHSLFYFIQSNIHLKKHIFLWNGCLLDVLPAACIYALPHYLPRLYEHFFLGCDVSLLKIFLLHIDLFKFWICLQKLIELVNSCVIGDSISSAMGENHLLGIDSLHLLSVNLINCLMKEVPLFHKLNHIYFFRKQYS